MSYIKKKSMAQEKRTAKEFGGKMQVASGALWGSKGDVRTGGDRTSDFNSMDFLIENKFTDKNYYLFQFGTWDKIKKEAICDNFRIPMMQIDILEDMELVVLDYNDYMSYSLDKELDVYDWRMEVTNKSFRINHSDITRLEEEAYEQMKTLVVSVEFNNGKDRIVILKKDDFQHIWN